MRDFLEMFSWHDGLGPLYVIIFIVLAPVVLWGLFFTGADAGFVESDEPHEVVPMVQTQTVPNLGKIEWMGPEEPKDYEDVISYLVATKRPIELGLRGDGVVVWREAQ